MTYRRSHVQVGTDENPHESNESSVVCCPVHMSTGPPASEQLMGLYGVCSLMLKVLLILCQHLEYGMPQV